jgi:hypothetical protein
MVSTQLTSYGAILRYTADERIGGGAQYYGG